MELPRDTYGQFRILERRVDVGNSTKGMLADSNPDRIALIIGNADGGTSWVRPSQTVDVQDGIPISAGSQRLEIYHRDSGPLCAYEWWGISNAISNFVSVIEVVWDKPESSRGRIDPAQSAPWPRPKDHFR